MTQDVLAVAQASGARRWMAIGMQSTLGALLIYVALSQPPSFGWKLFLLVLGGASLWLATRTHAASQRRLELTREELRDSEGEVLAQISDIQGISRGTFAAKPSQGFTIILKKSKRPARWLPGVWWRLGRRVGVGGVTPGSQTKTMAQIIESLIVDQA